MRKLHDLAQRGLRSWRGLPPWWRWSAATVLGSLMILFGLSSCFPSIRASKAQVDALPRAFVEVPGVPGRKLSYLRAGEASGQRVIIIHGTPGSGRELADLLIPPLPGLETIAVDRLGFGESVTGVDGNGKPFRHAVVSFAEQAAAIAPLLVSRGGKWPIVAGHSLGGPIAARLAADYPDRVGGLVILAGSLDPGLEKASWYNYLIRWPPVRGMFSPMIRTSNEEIFAGLEQTTALGTVLERIRCPVVVMHGQQDKLVPVANVEYMRRKLTHAAGVKVILFPKEGHFIPWNQTPAIRRAIEDLAR